MAIHKFTRQILNGEQIEIFGNGSSSRDYTYIDDIVSGIEKVITKEFAFEIFNLGNNNPVSLNEFIQTLEKITDKKANVINLPLQAGDVAKTYADIKKAQELLNWQPQTSLEKGLEKFVKWYKENRA